MFRAHPVVADLKLVVIPALFPQPLVERRSGYGDVRLTVIFDFKALAPPVFGFFKIKRL